MTVLSAPSLKANDITNSTYTGLYCCQMVASHRSSLTTTYFSTFYEMTPASVSQHSPAPVYTASVLPDCLNAQQQKALGLSTKHAITREQMKHRLTQDTATMSS